MINGKGRAKLGNSHSPFRFNDLDVVFGKMGADGGPLDRHFLTSEVKMCPGTFTPVSQTRLTIASWATSARVSCRDRAEQSDT